MEFPNTIYSLEFGSDVDYADSSSIEDSVDHYRDCCDDDVPELGEFDLFLQINDSFAIYYDYAHPGNGKMISVTNPRVLRMTIFESSSDDGYFAERGSYSIDDGDIIPDHYNASMNLNDEEIEEVSSVVKSLMASGKMPELPDNYK